MNETSGSRDSVSCIVCGNPLPPGRRALCSEECVTARARQRNKMNAEAWWPTKGKMATVIVKCPLCEALWKTKMDRQPFVMPRIYCRRCRLLVSQFKGGVT